MNDDTSKQSLDRFIDALLKNNSVVISEIYSRFFPKALRFILQNHGTRAQAKDIFQESLMYIIIGVKERNLKIDNFEAYVFTICKNMWRREIEKQKKRVIKDGLYTLEDKETNFASFMIEQERLELYHEKFSLLSDNCREILSLFFNDVSYEDIVLELSYATINTARQRIFKCKSKLIKLIKSDSRFN